MMYKAAAASQRQLALSFQMIAGELDDKVWDFTMQCEDQARFYSFRVFMPGEAPERRRHGSARPGRPSSG